MFKNKTVLVTGGAGFIGSHIIDRCLKEHAKEVICLDNFSGTPDDRYIKHLENNPRFVLINKSINDVRLMKILVEDCDVIFNNAASKLVMSIKNPSIDVKTNVVGNFNILEAIRYSKRQPRLIHASTVSVYGTSNKPFKEDDKRRPNTIYGINKLTADNYIKYYIKNYGLKATILHYCHVYGPRQSSNSIAGVINIMLGDVIKGGVPTVNKPGTQIRCFTYVGDVVEANMFAYKNKKTINAEYNIASKVRMSIKELGNIIIRKYGKPGTKYKIGEARIGECLKPVPNTNKIEKLGFKCETDFETGLDITKKWIDKELKNEKN